MCAKIDVEIRFTEVYNECRDLPNFFSYEIDVEIRLRILRNGFQDLFPLFFCFL